MRLGRVFHARAEADPRVRVPEPLGVLRPRTGVPPRTLNFADPPESRRAGGVPRLGPVAPRAAAILPRP